MSRCLCSILFLIPDSSFLLMQSQGIMVTAQVLGFSEFSTVYESWIKFLAPSFGPTLAIKGI